MRFRYYKVPSAASFLFCARRSESHCSSVKFFDHRHAQTIERVGGFVILSALIVAEEGKDQAAATRSFGEARERSDVFDRASLGVDSTGGDCALHAVLQR